MRITGAHTNSAFAHIHGYWTIYYDAPINVGAGHKFRNPTGRLVHTYIQTTFAILFQLSN